jgi:DNA-binding response OmpR family regulator
MTMITDQRTQATILIVDDESDNLSVLFDALGQEYSRLLVALDGESALRQIHAALPDLILLDVMMPGIDGFETCRRLKADPITAPIPVIFMTARSEAVYKVQGFDVGGADYITKPFQIEEVLSRVQAQLTIRRQQERLREQELQIQAQQAQIETLRAQLQKLTNTDKLQ